MKNSEKKSDEGENLKNLTKKIIGVVIVAAIVGGFYFLYQTRTGGEPQIIFGVVKAPASGETPIPGAVVKAFSFDKKEILGSGRTDEEGRYEVALTTRPSSSILLVAVSNMSAVDTIRLTAILPTFPRQESRVKADLNSSTAIAASFLSKDYGRVAKIEDARWSAAVQVAKRLVEVMGLQKLDFVIGGPINPERLEKGLKAKALRDAMHAGLEGEKEAFLNSVVAIEVEPSEIHLIPHPLPLRIWGRTVRGERISLEGKDLAVDLTGLNATLSEEGVILVQDLEDGYFSISHMGLSTEVPVKGVPDISASSDELDSILQGTEEANEEFNEAETALNASMGEWEAVEERARFFLEYIGVSEERKEHFLRELIPSQPITWMWRFDIEGNLQWEKGSIFIYYGYSTKSEEREALNFYQRGPFIIKEVEITKETYTKENVPYLQVSGKFKAEPCDGPEYYDLPTWGLVVNEEGGGMRQGTMAREIPPGWSFNKSLKGFPLMEGETPEDFLVYIGLSVHRYYGEGEARDAAARQFNEYIERQKRALEAKLDALEELSKIDRNSPNLKLAPILNELREKMSMLSESGPYNFLKNSGNFLKNSGIRKSRIQKLQKGLDVISQSSALVEFYSNVDSLTGEERVRAIKAALDLGKAVVPTPKGMGHVLDFYSAALDAIADGIGNIERSMSDRIISYDPETFKDALKTRGRGLGQERLEKAYNIHQLLVTIKDP